MKYLIKFNEDVKFEETPEEVSKEIFKYFEDYGVNGLYFWDMQEILREVYPEDHDDIQYDDYLSYDEILISVSYLLGKWKKSDIFSISRYYDRFRECYPNIKRLTGGMTKEEIEDFFVGIGYKVKISKTSGKKGVISYHHNHHFLVDIMSIDEKDITSIFNRIWSVIGSRIPNEYYIKDVFLVRHHYPSDIDIRVSICLKELEDDIEEEEEDDDYA